MPRRKKSGQSPARVPGGPPDGEAFGYDAGYRAPQGYDSGMATNFSQGSSVPASDRENIVRGMREMFFHLEPEVIHIVLSECDFKVENAMDSLLELSRAAENAAPNPSPVSGFERTAAALLSPEHFSAPGPGVSEAQQQQQQQQQQSRLSPSPSANLLTDELDLLLDQELQTLTEKEHGGEEGQRGSHYSPAGASFPTCPPLPQQLLPELLQSSLGSGSSHPLAEQPCPDLGHLLQGISGTSSSLDQLSTWPEETTGDQQPVVDFSHLLTETPTEKPKPPLDLAASSRPSAFQVYKKQEQSHGMDKTAALTSEGLEAGAKANGKSPWNLDSAEFLPRASGNQGPYFLTPVAPSHWTGQIRHTAPWLGHGPVSQAPLKPSATIPKSWAMPAAAQPPSRSGRLHLEGKVLVLLRGPPGSGKSFLARALQQHNPGGVVLSTDDYYYQNGEYRFDPATLGVAHEWNHKRAKEAFEKGTYPIIIDNTNMQGWEMRPYVVQALRHNYKVLFREPDTWWKNKPRELERRTSHNVSLETIRRMINGYERFVTVQSIMGSAMPDRKRLQLLDSSENTNHKPVTSETLCPDLVRGPTLTEQCKNSRPHLFSSLPDVSSIGQSAEPGMSEDGGCKSSDSLNIQPTGRTMGDMEKEDNVDMGALDSELEMIRGGEQRIPDCIVESVMSEDQIGAEIPVAFSESIGQRVRRERPSRRSEFNNRMSASDLVRDTNQSEEPVEKTERLHAGEGRDTADKQMTFVGDWPAEPSLQQRQARRRERCQEESGKDEGGAAKDEDNGTKKGLSGPDLTEFQKLLDLIQTGEATHPISSSSSNSPVLMEELEREIDAGDSFEKKHCDSRLELPDCVLDMDDREGIGSENAASAAPESNDEVGTFLSVAQTSKEEEEEEEIGNFEGEGAGSGAAGPAERDFETGAHLDSGSSVCDECMSPAGEASVEAESGVSGGAGAERKQRSGRRSGKQCKLALTFSSSLQTPECTNAAAPQSPSSTDTEHSTGSCLLTTHFDPWEQPSPPPPVGSSRASQTEPQDFALLWRINHQNGSEDAVVATSGHLRILSCPSSPNMRNVLDSTAVASQLPPSDPREVPYRVVHEKGTQVDEKEFGPTRDRLESLRILSRHFKLVSFDTLEDLYDKCQHDLEWTTNLLLDSGERFFRDEDGEDEESEAQDELRGWNGSGAQEGLLGSDHSGPQGQAAETELGCSAQQESPSDGVPETGSAEVAKVTEPSTCETSSSMSFGDEAPAEESTAITTQAQFDPPSSELEEKRNADIESTQEASQHGPRGEGAWGWRPADDGVIVEECRVELDDEIATMEEINRLLQEELDQEEKHGRGERERGHTAKRRLQHLDIHSLELKLPTELALQLTELFGPVGVDPGTCSPDDYAVQMDLSLAKLLHQKWKDTIQESQRQAALSFHLLQENGYASAGNAPDHRAGMPFMDHWNVSRQHVSLRDIIREEQALQENVEKSRQSRADLDKRDGATLLKEQQLYSRFPTIDRHFLQDIFRDHNYCLMETELFLNSLLGEEPVKTVVAPEAPRSDHHRTASKEREKRQKALESSMLMYQDTEDPEYEDFRAEADLQRSRQMESFSKAAEAYKQGRKDVAAFYADQGRMHGQRMREANHRAAVQIFERVNASLLPRNILDLHGLHVDEALHHLGQVLQDKTADCEQGLCQPRLSVITGRGNHSQGGVARIRPAVIDYLTNKHYRFAEPKAGLVLVSLK